MTTAKASRAKTQSSSPSEATEEAQTDDYAQRFDLLRLIYYHDDARQFNVFMHNATTFSTILLGSLVAGTFISDHLGPFAPYFGLAVAILQSVDFVVDFQSKANMHSAEKAIYNELFTRLSFDRSAANIHKIENEKLVNFERGSEKYTPFWGVDAVAWNSAYSQLTGSTDFEADELFPINFIEMALRHLVRFSPSYFREKKKRAQRIKHGKRVALYYVI
ncbi:MAG: hypothetical protein P4M15_10285, partial [Alphaproteobacteria bacterium]|nr:hypothetical protein [Alphaproteobacteria bacterium]